MLWQGPQPQTRADRWRMVDRIVADLHRVYGGEIVAIGLYGSLARGEDGDYSDIELWCALDRAGVDQTAEWVYGPGKAEVNVCSVDVLRRDAVMVTANWSLAQGARVNVRPLYGDLAFFDELSQLVFSPPKHVFDAVIAEMLVGECYEWVGKLRNATGRSQTAALPRLACDFVTYVALMAGLAHRRVYRSGGAMLEEALGLDGIPAGFAELAALTTSGDLGDAGRVAAALEVVWTGLGPWCGRMAIDPSPRTIWSWS